MTTNTGQVTAGVDTVTRTVEYVIDGAEPMTMSWGHQQFRPRRLVVTVERTAEADWKMKAVDAHGPRLLKSGKDGGEERERDLCAGVRRDEGWIHVVDPDAPQWAADCVERTIREAR